MPHNCRLQSWTLRHGLYAMMTLLSKLLGRCRLLAGDDNADTTDGHIAEGKIQLSTGEEKYM